MNELLTHLYLALPQLIIGVTACFALVAELFISHRRADVVYGIASTGLIAAVVSAMLFMGYPPESLVHDMLRMDDMTYFLQIFIAITVFFALTYAHQYLKGREVSQGDYMILALFATLGMMTLVASHHLLLVYLSLELLSLPLYALTAMRRGMGLGAEAAMKYFVMGAIASGLLLYGISLLYGATGVLDFSSLSTALKAETTSSMFVGFALVFMLAGIAFKLAAVPFHMWAPDVYEGSLTPVALLIGSAPKIAVIGMLVRLFNAGFVDLSAQWQPVILILALLSTGLGNILAIVQSNLKRLFAYSAISHMGYALFGFIPATSAGYSAAMYYAIVYALMAAAGFGLLAILSQTAEIEMIDDLKGLNRRNPWLAGLMMIVLFSMAGVPPMVGFFAKLLILKALVDSNMMWVAILGLLFAVIGAFYYLRVIKVMYFDAPSDDSPLKLSKGINFIFSINGLSLLYLGLCPSALIATCTHLMT